MPAPAPYRPIVLASASPRRRDLLAAAGIDFEVEPPPVEEPRHLAPGLTPAAQAAALAYFKARAVADGRRERTVLAADTIVAAGGEVLGKPTDAHDARRMLRLLSHNRHEVLTGVALLLPDGRRRVECDGTVITIRPMTDEEVEAYVASGEWIGKAGGYAIQETADRFVTAVDGSFTNVVGLPMERVERMLREMGVPRNASEGV